jgi:N-ethylmaleimide reductase
MYKLFSPASIGSIQLKNHIVMAPMTRSRAIGNVPNELMAEYYAQRSNAGLIITEGTSPSPNGLGYARIPGIFNEEQVKGWSKTTEAVHERGGKIFLQLMHTGRVGHPDNLPSGAKIFAPSAVAMEAKIWTDQNAEQQIPLPKEMTLEEINQTIQEYVDAAKNAKTAGFDGVELHGANGYFPEQFLNPASNHRTDAYGGSVEKRSKFLLSIVHGMATAIGKDKIGIRLSPYGVFNEMPTYPEVDATYDYLSKELFKEGIAYIHLVDHSSMGAPAVPEDVVKNIRRNFKNTIILSGGYDIERAEEALVNGNADLIAFGRDFLANPDLVKRFTQKFPLNAPKFELFYTAGADGYTDYPVFEKMKVL